ncbi:MAG TPA: MFS transporter [Thermoanaerobaculia bacterium]
MTTSTVLDASPATISRSHSARWTLATLSLAMLLSSLGTSIANVALPAMAQAFAGSFQQVQWVVLIYLLTTTTVIVSAGRLGDVIGRTRLLVAGISLFTVASLACGLAPTLPLLIAARMAQGLGAAVMMALAIALVGETVPSEKTGSAMGLLGTMSAVGTALGPSLGGVLTARFGWSSVFFATFVPGLLTLVLAHRHLPADRPAAVDDRARFDHVGTLLLAVTLSSYALAMTLGRGTFGAINAAFAVAAVLGLGLFILAESRIASPLIRLDLIRDPVLRGGLAMSTLVTTVVMATLVVGPFYLSGALALDATRVGLAMSCGPIVAALTGAPAGRIVDRIGAYRVTIYGLVAMAASSLILPAMPAKFGVAGYVIPLAALTAGYALFQAANNTAVMIHVRSEQRGVISGLLTLSRNIGLITGASAMGAVFATAARATDMASAAPMAIAEGMRMTFYVAAGLIVLALFIAYRSRRTMSAQLP